MYAIIAVVIVGVLMGLPMLMTAVKSSEEDKHYKELIKRLKSLKFFEDDDDVTGQPMGRLFAKILNQTLYCHGRDLATYLQEWEELEKSREWYGDNQYAITMSQDRYQQRVGHQVAQGMLELVASDLVLV